MEIGVYTFASMLSLRATKECLVAQCAYYAQTDTKIENNFLISEIYFHYNLILGREENDSFISFLTLLFLRMEEHVALSHCCLLKNTILWLCQARVQTMREKK